jgi:hypothetical protein
VFSSCDSEAFDDDYTLYVMGYDEKNEVIADNGGGNECGATLETGGCDQSRCSKTDNTNVKICTLDGTPCTLAECQDHCTTHDGFVCTFYAWDEAESECYLFDGCKSSSEDADYTTFARTCGKSLTEGGCADRRCSKDENNYEKICVNGESECTLSQCEAFCDAHTAWECAFFAYEAAEKECYIFDGCRGESEDTYVLYSRACSKTFAEGGCENRRCDKGLTDYVKSCTDDEAGVTDCTAEECRDMCDTNTDKDGVALGWECNWFGFEAGPNECYLFRECRNEGEDTYTMYVKGADDGEDGEDEEDMDGAASENVIGTVSVFATIFAMFMLLE